MTKRSTIRSFGLNTLLAPLLLVLGLGCDPLPEESSWPDTFLVSMPRSCAGNEQACETKIVFVGRTHLRDSYDAAPVPGTPVDPSIQAWVTQNCSAICARTLLPAASCGVDTLETQQIFAWCTPPGKEPATAGTEGPLPRPLLLDQPR